MHFCVFVFCAHLFSMCKLFGLCICTVEIGFMVIRNFLTSFTWLRANKSGPKMNYCNRASPRVFLEVSWCAETSGFLFGKMAHVTKREGKIEKQKGTPRGEQKDTRAGSFWHTGTCLLSCISTFLRGADGSAETTTR